MEDKEKIKLEVVFQSPLYGQVACLIEIVDFGAIARFSDARLARDMFNKEKQLGNKNQLFVERLSSIAERFPGKKKEEIAKELITKFKEHNATVKQK